MYLRAEGTSMVQFKGEEVAVREEKHQNKVDLLNILRGLSDFLILSHSTILRNFCLLYHRSHNLVNTLMSKNWPN